MLRSSRQPRLVFDRFEIDLHSCELRKGGRRVRLQAQPFQLLALLVERAGEVVTREEICRALWQRDTFVDFDHGVAVALNKIREALGDDAEKPRFIKTLPKQGYRFIAPVQELGPRLFQMAASAPRGGRTPVENQPLAAAPVALPAYDGEEGWAKEKAERPAAMNRQAWRTFRRWLPWLAGAAALTVGAAVYALRARPSRSLRESIVIADFDNRTGDPVFDGTLREGLAAQLDQSPFLNIMSDQQVAESLRLMSQPAGLALRPDLARQLCERTGGAAVLEGSIGQIGSQYNIVLDAINCSTGASLARAQAVASDKNHVLDALGNVATSIRGKLGESLASIQKFDKPLAEVTTPSLDALQAFTRGFQANGNGDYFSAVPSLQRAISLDPNFAMAYATLGMAYYNFGELALASENTSKAYDLRDRVSEREKFYISSDFEMSVTGDLIKADQVYELWSQIYPRDFAPVNDMSLVDRQLGQYQKALKEALRAIELEHFAGNPYGNAAMVYLILGRLDEAASILQQAQAHGIDSASLHYTRYWLAFLRNDAAAMAREAAWGSGKPGIEDVFLSMQSETLADAGKLSEANDFTSRAIASAQQAGEKEIATGLQAGSALREAVFGDASRARSQAAAAALKISNDQDDEAAAAVALAIAGDAARARKLADDLAKSFPKDTLVQFIYLPTIHAAIALDRNAPAKAIADLKAASPYELGQTSGVTLYPVYVRGLAYLAARQGSQAAAEFQKILDHHGVALQEVIVPLAHLGLARARALSGDKAGARKAYQDFLALWQHADPDIPILRQAKSEYAKLQ